MKDHKPTCFVLCPFGGRHDSYYREIIVPAVSTLGLRVKRADEIYGARPIIDDIIDAIREARLIVADVSGRNPNVNYELGLAHAFGIPTIIISSTLDDVPFDYKHRRVIVYDNTVVKWDEILAQALQANCRAILSEESGALMAKSLLSEHKAVVQYLTRLQKTSSYLISKECRIETDTNGNSTISQNWTIDARSYLTHIYHKILLDRPASIEELRIHDSFYGVGLDYVIEDVKPTFANYFILLANGLEPGDQGQLRVEFRVRGYLNELVEKGRAIVFHQSRTGGKARLGKKREVYLFPDTNKFKKLRGVVMTHPENSRIGSVIKSRIVKGKRTITLDFEALDTRDEKYAVELLL